MTNTLVRPPQVVFEEPKPRRRFRIGAVALVMVAAGAAATGVAVWNEDPVLPATWNFPTTIEELIESGFVPVESLGSIAENATKWVIPTSIDDLIESGFDPTS